jgi:hypothetical protein
MLLRPFLNGPIPLLGKLTFLRADCCLAPARDLTSLDRGRLGDCKRSASIRLPQRRHMVPPRSSVLSSIWLGTCSSAERRGTH